MPSSSPAELIDAARAGNRRALARLLTMVERGGNEARAVDKAVSAFTGNAYIIGITGAPGADKSTLTDQVIATLRSRGEQIAAIAVDPSSPFTGGALLGDRVRMQQHATDNGVFVRSMATRGHLGGLADATRGSLRVVDAAGFPTVVLETVGVGQVEVEVTDVADTSVVVVNPGWGDSVQANKAGLMETADVFVINKADRGDVAATERDLRAMLEFAPDAPWRPPIIRTTATDGEGISDLLDAVQRHRDYLSSSGEGARRRRRGAEVQVRSALRGFVEEDLAKRATDVAFADAVETVLSGQSDPHSAARRLWSGEVGSST